MAWARQLRASLGVRLNHLWLLCVFLLAPTLGISQNPSVSEPASSPSPEVLTSQLGSADKDVRAKAARAVSLTGPIGGALCSDFDTVKTEPLQVQDSKESRLLVAKSDDCQNMFLVPLVRRAESWQSLGSIRLSMHDGTVPECKVQNLVSKDDQEIVVSNVMVDWGTGFLQTNLTIYKVIGDRVRVVFDEPESLHLAIPDMRVPVTNNYSEEQNSTFQFVNDTGHTTFGHTYILEKRIDRIGKRKFTVYRSYVWEPALSAFRMIGAGLP